MGVDEVFATQSAFAHAQALGYQAYYPQPPRDFQAIPGPHNAPRCSAPVPPTRGFHARQQVYSSAPHSRASSIYKEVHTCSRTRPRVTSKRVPPAGGQHATERRGRHPTGLAPPPGTTPPVGTLAAIPSMVKWNLNEFPEFIPEVGLMPYLKLFSRWVALYHAYEHYF